jgi:phage replication O-like protein O
MKCPQLENGYTKISNELLEAIIKIKIASNEKSILLAILRKTYGWGKKEDKISYTQLENLTGLNRSNVNKGIKALVAKMILVAKQQPSGNIYQIQKDYSRWTSCRADTSCRLATTLVAKQQTQLVAKQQHTKEKKETIQKKEYIPIMDLTEDIFQEIAKRYKVPLAFVLSKYEDMVNWHKSTGKVRKDWVATLRNFVKRDAIKISDRSAYASRTRGIDATKLL